MKKIMLCLFMAFAAMTIYAKDIKEYVVTTNPQMSCQNCENKIKGNLRFEKGIKKVETNLADQTVKVTYDADKTDEAKINEAFGKLNYKVKKVGATAKETKSCKKESCGRKSGNCCNKSHAADKNSDSCCKNNKNTKK